GKRCPPERQRLVQPAPDQRRVDRLLLVREHADRDRGLRVAVAGGEVTPAGGVDRDRLARLRALEARGDRAREDPRMAAAHRALAPRLEREAPHLGGRPGNHGGCGERSGGARRQPRCQMAARSSLLRRPTPGARPARRTSSVVAALAALATRLVRLAHHDYPDGLLMAIEAGGAPLAERLRPLLARRARGEEAAELAPFPRLPFARGAGPGGGAERPAAPEGGGTPRESFPHIAIPRSTDAAALARLEADIRDALEDVRLVTDDFAAMVARAQAVAAELDGLGRSRSAQLATEATAVADFLRWLVDGAFVFLGYREYGLTTLGAAAMLQLRAGSGLGILRRE